MKFWVHDGKNVTGPFDVEGLRNLSSFGPETMVAHQGMTSAAAWKPAKNHEDLRVLFGGPPPLPPALLPAPNMANLFPYEAPEGSNRERIRPAGIAALGVFKIILSGLGALAVLWLVNSGPKDDAFTSFLCIFIGIFSVLEIFMGLALLLGASWIWWVEIVHWVVALFAFPVGTVLGSLFLYYLTRPHVKEWFHAGSVVL